MRATYVAASLLALAAAGASPAVAANDPFIGEIMMFGGGFCPAGWAEAAGQLVAIAENQALFSIVGTDYGGDGARTFALPDLRGRMAIGVGAGQGLTPVVQGKQGGREQVTLTVAEMPTHTHLIGGSSASADTTQANGAMLATSPDGQPIYTSSGALDTPLNGAVVAPAGGSQPFGVQNPYLAIHFCVALTGVYPSRN